jgi:lipoate-protein ligase B
MPHKGTDSSVTKIADASSSDWDCHLYNIERISYTKALDIQHRLHDRCASGDVPGAILLLEHDPVITMGVKTHAANLLCSPQVLRASGIDLAKTDRGGDITYHGPGQLVGYPILPLRKLGLDVHGFLRKLEQSIIDALAEFGLEGSRNGPAGVWVGDKKVCSIGIAVRKWVTYHGFALNVDPITEHFALINPCGLSSDRITSLRELMAVPPDMAVVREVCAREMALEFGLRLIREQGEPG